MHHPVKIKRYTGKELPPLNLWALCQLLWATIMQHTSARVRLLLSLLGITTVSLLSVGYLVITSPTDMASKPATTKVPNNIPENISKPVNLAIPFVGETSHYVDDRQPEAAPKAPASETTAKAYIQRFARIAQAEQKKFGVPASISLAQGLIESRAGNSKLAVNNNNHFGMKCFSKHCRKGHCTNFTDDTHKDFFLKFSTAFQSWDAHAKLISSGRYKHLKRYGADYRRWASGLKAVGYATDRTYAQKLIGIIERYNLNQYD